MDKNKKNVRKRLNIIIEQRNISIKFLSQETGISKIKLYFLLNSNLCKLTLLPILSICKCLNIRVESLFE